MSDDLIDPHFGPRGCLIDTGDGPSGIVFPFLFWIYRQHKLFVFVVGIRSTENITVEYCEKVAFQGMVASAQSTPLNLQPSKLARYSCR